MSNGLAIAQMAAAGLSLHGAMQSAEAQQQSAYDNAAQLDQRAGAARAKSQLDMARKARADKSDLSEQRTALANSGFAADDASSLHIVGATVEEQTLQQMLIKAQGEQEAAGLEAQAKQMRRDGRNDAKATRSEALAKAGGDAVSWHHRYGGSRRASPSSSSSSGSTTRVKKARTG